MRGAKTMKVGLIDVDSHNFPNLAQMKISAYHKANGDEVERWNGLKHYDIVYKSKVFTDEYSQDEEHIIMADEVISGGTGYDIENKLPHDIEHTCPDYSLYRITNQAYGFLTRGCPRNCPFCIVSDKEGKKVETVAELGEFWQGQKEIVLLDSNITASKDCLKHFDTLIDSGAWVDFQSGLDIRFMTEEKADRLNRMEIKMLHFAWDNYEFGTYNTIKAIRPLLNISDRNLIVYVLTNYNTTHEQDLERIYKLKELDCSPYVMIYNKASAPKITKRLQRWCNNRFIFRAVDRFEDYDEAKG